MKNRLTILILLGAVVACIADPITISIEGTIVGWTGNLGDEFVFGELFNLDYTYDLVTPDLNNSVHIGQYGLTAFDGAIGDYAWTFNSGTYDIYPADPNVGDQIFVFGTSLTGADIGDTKLTDGMVYFRDFDKTFLLNDSLIPHAPQMSFMEQAGFTLNFNSADDELFLVAGQINSVTGPAMAIPTTPTSVPEPSIVTLLSLGVIAFGVFRFNRKR